MCKDYNEKHQRRCGEKMPPLVCIGTLKNGSISQVRIKILKQHGAYPAAICSSVRFLGLVEESVASAAWSFLSGDAQLMSDDNFSPQCYRSCTRLLCFSADSLSSLLVMRDSLFILPNKALTLTLSQTTTFQSELGFKDRHGVQVCVACWYWSVYIEPCSQHAHLFC